MKYYINSGKVYSLCFHLPRGCFGGEGWAEEYFWELDSWEYPRIP